MTFTATVVTNWDNVIDSRDVIAQLAELTEAATHFDLDPDKYLDEEARRAFAALRDLARQGAEGIEDWEYGAMLVRESYFAEYTRELAEETSEFTDWSQWPWRHIDWDAAAEELKQDYTQVDFDGVTYYAR